LWWRVLIRQSKSQTGGSGTAFLAVHVWEDEMLEVLLGTGKPKYEPAKAIAFHTHSTAEFYGDYHAVESD
jgi:hypothetical protein